MVQGKSTSGNEMVKMVKPSADELGSLVSFDDAVKFLASKGFSVTTVDEILSDGFEAVQSKDDLINRPFIIVDAKVALSKEYTDDEGDPARFVVCKVITQDGKRLRFTDGSVKSGIANQILTLDAKREGGACGAIMYKGLTVSSYDYIDDKGKKTPAKTYYFATA